MSNLTITDEKNPQSLINITPSSVSNALKSIPDSIWELSEDDLAENVKRITPKGFDTINMLRDSFWREFDQATRAGRMIHISNVYGGICSSQFFLKEIVNNSYKVAYICSPPKDYEIAMRHIMNLGLKQIQEIINLPLMIESGKYAGMNDSKLAHVKYLIMRDIIPRVMGAVPHRIQTENLNVNVDQTNHPQYQLPKSMEEVEERLKQLEKQSGDIGQDSEVIDVSQEETEKEET